MGIGDWGLGIGDWGSDINNEYKLLEKLKKFIFNYIKINRKNKNIQNSANIIETILLAEAKDGIRFFNLENNGINLEDDHIKKISEIIKSIASKLEIKQKKNEEKEKQEKALEWLLFQQSDTNYDNHLYVSGSIIQLSAAVERYFQI